MTLNQSEYVFQLQVGLQANVPQPYDDDEDGGDHNTTVDDIEAALTDLQVRSLDTETKHFHIHNSNDKTRFQMFDFSNLAIP